MSYHYPSFPWGTLSDKEDPSDNCNVLSEECHDGYEGGCPEEATYTIAEIAHLLDQMIMDIQHLELETVRARYKLSFHLAPPYDEYLRMEIFSSLGSRYGGDPVYDDYLTYSGLGEDEDAIDTPFHLSRMRRLREGHDDYPDYYP